jgi:hypothetical protein
MLFRFRFKRLGGHTHLRVFAGKTEASLGLCGNLAMRNEEFMLFMETFDIGETPDGQVEVEFLPEIKDSLAP